MGGFKRRRHRQSLKSSCISGMIGELLRGGKQQAGARGGAVLGTCEEEMTSNFRSHESRGVPSWGGAMCEGRCSSIYNMPERKVATRLLGAIRPKKISMKSNVNGMQCRNNSSNSNNREGDDLGTGPSKLKQIQNCALI